MKITHPLQMMTKGIIILKHALKICYIQNISCTRLEKILQANFLGVMSKNYHSKCWVKTNLCRGTDRGGKGKKFEEHFTA